MSILQSCSVTQMQEVGLFVYWFNDKRSEENDLLKQNIKVLKLTDVKSIFFLWSIGLFLATFYFLLDCLYSFLFVNTNQSFNKLDFL